MSIDKVTREEWDKLEELKKTNKVDMVNKPPHYQGKIECIDLIKDRVGSNNFPAYLEGNIWKYLFRHKNKDSNIECLEKAQWYLNALIKHYEEL
jgi:hypothetical protein